MTNNDMPRVIYANELDWDACPGSGCTCYIRQDGKFTLGDRVRKTKGSSWQGIIVGFYSTDYTPIGYAVESEREKGSVQIYPEKALELLSAEVSEYALAAFGRVIAYYRLEALPEEYVDQSLQEDLETIRRALAIADALERGPSEEMVKAGHEVFDCSLDVIFEAMTTQLKKEIGDG